MVWQVLSQSREIVSLYRNHPSSKLYVGGLPYTVSDGQLSELFSPHGTVESARVITDRMTGRSRGFGFVEMATQAEADAAVEGLNGTQLEGRSLTVNEAKQKEARSGYGRSSFGRGRSNY
jgi:RNA recognition motif-containing protein